MLHRVQLLISVLGIGLASIRHVGAESVASEPPPAAGHDRLAVTEMHHWSVEFGSGALFSNVRVSHLDSYTLVPLEISLTRSFEKNFFERPLGGFFRGSPEVFVRAYHTWIARGTESRLDGFNFGARYNFIQPGRAWIPFAEASLGAAFADSRGVTVDGRDRGLGQDFNFNFTVSTGVRYDISDRWFVRLAAVYSHYSNAGLSEPERENRQIDAAGPVLSVGYRF